MKTCKQYKSKLANYLAGKLSTDQSVDVAAHLKICPGCRIQAEKMEKLADAFLSPSNVPVNPFLYTRIQNRLLTPTQPKKSLVARFLQPAAYVVVLFLGIYLGIQLGYSTKSDTASSYADAYVESLYFNEMKLDPITTNLLQAEEETEIDKMKKEENDENQQ